MEYRDILDAIAKEFKHPVTELSCGAQAISIDRPDDICIKFQFRLIRLHESIGLTFVAHDKSINSYGRTHENTVANYDFYPDTLHWLKSCVQTLLDMDSVGFMYRILNFQNEYMISKLMRTTSRKQFLDMLGRFILAARENIEPIERSRYQIFNLAKRHKIREDEFLVAYVRMCKAIDIANRLTE